MLASPGSISTNFGAAMVFSCSLRVRGVAHPCPSARPGVARGRAAAREGIIRPAQARMSIRGAEGWGIPWAGRAGFKPAIPSAREGRRPFSPIRREGCSRSGDKQHTRLARFSLLGLRDEYPRLKGSEGQGRLSRPDLDGWNIGRGAHFDRTGPYGRPGPRNIEARVILRPGVDDDYHLISLAAVLAIRAAVGENVLSIGRVDVGMDVEEVHFVALQGRARCPKQDEIPDGAPQRCPVGLALPLPANGIRHFVVTAVLQIVCPRIPPRQNMGMPTAACE